jgi:hypothetical protein
MARLIDLLSAEERQTCETAGRAALDAVLARLSDAQRAAVWHSIRCGYIQPVTGAAAKVPASAVPVAVEAAVAPA